MRLYALQTRKGGNFGTAGCAIGWFAWAGGMSWDGALGVKEIEYGWG
jgi:hypothetical protein